MLELLRPWQPAYSSRIGDFGCQEKTKVHFLMETKVRRHHAERVRVKLGFDGLFYVEGVGTAGRLALLWKDRNTVRLLSFSKNHIDVEVRLPGMEASRRLPGTTTKATILEFTPDVAWCFFPSLVNCR